MQDQVANRLEKRIQEVAYLLKIETTIRPGQANLQVEFQDNTPKEVVPDLFYEVRKRMQEEAGNLPEGVIGPIVNDDFADVYFNLIALTAPGLPMRLVTRDAETIRDRIRQVPGVRKALILGERSERVFVEFDPVRLNNLGLSPTAIFEAIDAHNRLMPAGRIETNGPRLYLRLDADLSVPEALANVPLRIGERVIRLADIATVRRGYEEPPSYLVRSRGQDAVLIGVVMENGANGLELGERLESFIEEERTRLPLGMSLNVLTNQADAITGAVNLFQIKFFVAVAVVVAISILAIGLRAGLIVGIAVPLTLGISFLIMLMMGINLDRVTLGALILALGLLVDDAIISVEMMLVKMEEGWDRVKAAAHAWTVTAAPMLFGTLVTVAGFIPIGFAQSAVGEYTGNIFWVLGISLIVSWLVAVIFVPYLGVKMLPAQHTLQVHEQSKARTPHQPYQSPRYQRLRSLITWCVIHRKTVVAFTIGLLLLAIVGMATVVQKQFFPTSDRPEVLISVFMPPGTSIEATDRTVQKLEALLSPMEEIESLSAYIGAGAPRFFISANPEMPDPGFAKLIAVTTDAQARDRVIGRIKQAIDNGQFPEARVRAKGLLYGPPVTWPVALRVLGPHPDTLRDIAYDIRNTMQQHPHIRGAHLDWNERAPILHLNMDTERLRLLGMTPLDVSRQLQFQLEGVTVTQLRQDIRSVNVVARMAGLSHDARNNADILNRIEIVSPEGRKLPFSQLGKVEVRFEEPVVKRHNRERVLMVQADVEGAQPNDVSLALWDGLNELRNNLPAGYRLELAGSVEESAKGESSIQKMQPVMFAVMLIFIMMQMRSFSGTFMVVATAPLGLIGAVLALMVFNQPFGFVALLGLTGLAGILMRNTLILTQQVADNFEAGMPPFEGVVEAAVQRARPVVLTALAAVFAFVPLTLDTFWGPLAFVLIGGVAAGTAITLLFVPALYGLWFRIKPQERS
jgi:multidrug efflux pump subunit AcrB